MKKLLRVFYFVPLLPLGTSQLFAQIAAMVGSVKDTQESVISNAKVTLKNLDTGAALSVNADAAGNFEFATIRSG